MPCEKSVASIWAGWVSFGSAESRAKEAVPTPQALSWIIELDFMEEDIFGRKEVNTLAVELPVWRA
jgi:hypothetical protein